MAVATFDYAAWITLFPEFQGAVSEERAALLFAQAGLLYLNNTDCSPVQDVAMRQQLLYLLVAHLAALSGALDGGKPSGIVGRVTEATEGSVTVKSDNGMKPGSGGWYGLTNYGLMFWQATAWLDSGSYVPADPYVFESIRGAVWRR